MKKRFYTLILTLVFALIPQARAADDGGTTLSWESSGKKLQPADGKKVPTSNASGNISLARNEYEAIQLLIKSKVPLKNVDVKFSDLVPVKGGDSIPAKNIQSGLLKNVFVKEVLWPDPIDPFDKFDLAAKEFQSVWIKVYIPEGSPAGDYRGKVTVTADGLKTPLVSSLDVHVWDFSLPVTGTLKTASSWDMHPAYQEEILKYRYSPGGPFYGAAELANPKSILKANGEIDFDWTDYDAQMERFMALGLTTFGLPWSVGDGTGVVDIRMQHTFFDEAKGENVAITLNPLAGPEAEKLTIEWFKKFADHLREKGWLDKAFVYLWDEPGPNHNQKILAIGQVIKKAAPDLKIMLTEWPVEELYPVVDIFCTHVVNFRDEHLPVMQKAQAAGKELWWYTCDDPYPAPTSTIPHDALTLRTMSWLTWKFGLPGTLYSALSWSGDKDPYFYPGKNGMGGEQLMYPEKNG